MKRGLTIVIVVLIIVAVGVGLLWYLGSKSLTEQTNNTLGFIKISQKDTDSDGLSDAEEAFWGTDINNPDTNNDGVADGNSIQKNIDPVKTGNAPIEGVDNRIQALVRNAITNKGAPLVDISPTKLPATLVFAENNLRITKVEDLASITKYRDEIRVALKTYLLNTTGQETKSLLDFINTGNESALLAITTEKNKYLNLLKALTSITVPQSAATTHLAMLNSLSKITELIHYMTEVKSEPLLALKSSQAIFPQRDAFLASLVPLNNYFVERGLHEKIAS